MTNCLYASLGIDLIYVTYSYFVRLGASLLDFTTWHAMIFSIDDNPLRAFILAYYPSTQASDLKSNTQFSFYQWDKVYIWTNKLEVVDWLRRVFRVTPMIDWGCRAIFSAPPWQKQKYLALEVRAFIYYTLVAPLGWGDIDLSIAY